MTTLSAKALRRWLPRRSPIAHKGTNGHVLLVAGSAGMTGAAVLTAWGALRAGAGLATVAADGEVRRVVHETLPEAMAVPRTEMSAYLRRRRITTLAIGPGLGVGRAQKALILRLLKRRLPTVLDADGLNNLTLKELPRMATLIITPHEGELAHLRGESRERIHARRETVARDTARRFGGVCVLKGHHTLIATPATVYKNPTGNAAMATGGMGDVLTGVIAGLLAQGLSPVEAAAAGVYLHGAAGDAVARADRGLLAHEVADAIPLALSRVQRAS